MANKKLSTSKVHRDVQIGEFRTSIKLKPYDPPETTTCKRKKQSLLSVSDAKTELSNAISKAAKDDTQNSKSMTLKDAKRARRDVIVKTIMRHNRK